MPEKGIGRQFTKYVSLNILGMIGLSLYILADTFFVARGVGAIGLTALNLCIPVYSFIHGSGLMIGMGGATRYTLTRSSKVFFSSLQLTLLFALFYFLAGLLFASPLAKLLGGDSESLDLTVSYLRVILLFSPMFLLNNQVICFVRNDGNPKLAMLGMLFGSLANIVLDYIFIFPLGMGMFGAALATGIAPVISLLLLLPHVLKRKAVFVLSGDRLRLSEAKDILSLGISALIGELASGIVMILFNIRILMLSGNPGVAAYGILANIALVILAIFTGISQGMQPLLSKSAGRGDRKEARTILRYGVLLSAVTFVVVYVLCISNADALVRLFNRDNDPILQEMTVAGMRIFFVYLLFAALNVLSAAYFSAIAKPKAAFWISILRAIVLVFPITILLSSMFGMTGVWLSLPVTELLTAGVAMFFLLQEK